MKNTLISSSSADRKVRIPDVQTKSHPFSSPLRKLDTVYLTECRDMVQIPRSRAGLRSDTEWENSEMHLLGQIQRFHGLKVVLKAISILSLWSMSFISNRLGLGTYGVRRRLYICHSYHFKNYLNITNRKCIVSRAL